MKKIYFILISVLIFGLLTGCSKEKLPIDKQQKIVTKMSEMTSNNSDYKSIEAYVNKNIEKLDLDKASMMVNYLYQATGNEIQKSSSKASVIIEDVNKLADKNIDLNSYKAQSEIASESSKAIMKEILLNHHKMLLRDGYVYVYVNREYFENTYGKYIQNDLKDYMKYIENEEIKPTTTNNGAIDLKAVADRVLTIDSYIKNNKNSMFSLQWAYATVEYLNVLYGLNHSDFIDAKTLKYDKGIIKAYEEIAVKHKDDFIGKDIQSILTMIKANNGKYSEEIKAKYSKELENKFNNYLTSSKAVSDIKKNDETVDNKTSK